MLGKLAELRCEPHLPTLVVGDLNIPSHIDWNVNATAARSESLSLSHTHSLCVLSVLAHSLSLTLSHSLTQVNLFCLLCSGVCMRTRNVFFAAADVCVRVYLTQTNNRDQGVRKEYSLACLDAIP